MKKLLLFTLLISFTLAGCSTGQNTNSDNSSETEPKSEPKVPRTEDISKGINSEQSKFSYEYDFDSDGENETIRIDSPGFDTDYSKEQYIEITVGDYHKKYEIYEGVIEAVYACDMDLNDGKKDLAVITCEVSGDPRIRIVSYAPNLPAYHFYNEWSGESEDCLWLGYACNYYFNVNDDDSITLEMQTPSAGMWSVYQTYSADKSGVFKEDKPEHYEILPDFMEENYCYTEDYNPITGEEREMWEKGYIKAHKTFNEKDFTINEGEYFKVLYDNGNNEIFVEKEDGTSCWIPLSYDNCYELNEYFFYLAG